VLLYGYCCGVTSSRRLAQALEDHVAFRFLAANQQADFRTINEFRRSRLAALEGLFVEVLRLCRAAGLARMGRVALDGRKVAGNAALDRNRDADGIEREVRRILAEAERVERKLRTRRGRAAYRRRGGTIEAVFGQMATRGLNRFWLRGVDQVRAEWTLWCTPTTCSGLWRAHRAVAQALYAAA